MINSSGLDVNSALGLHDASNSLSHVERPVDGGLGGPTGNPPVVNTQKAVFDLGFLFNLTNTYIWNANQPGLTGRGVENFSIQYSADNVTFSAPTNLLATQGTGIALPAADAGDCRQQRTLREIQHHRQLQRKRHQYRLRRTERGSV